MWFGHMFRHYFLFFFFFFSTTHPIYIYVYFFFLFVHTGTYVHGSLAFKRIQYSKSGGIVRLKNKGSVGSWTNTQSCDMCRDELLYTMFKRIRIYTYIYIFRRDTYRNADIYTCLDPQKSKVGAKRKRVFSIDQ